MNKSEIISRLKALPYDPEQYWLLDGSAMCMRGLVRGAGAISLDCWPEMADLLEAEGFMITNDDTQVQKRTGRAFRLARDIFVYENRIHGWYDEIDGFQVITEQGQKDFEYHDLRYIGFDPETMKEFRTDHFVFRFAQGSTGERDIEIIAAKQEKYFREICDTLKVEPDFPIYYYLFESAADLNRNSERGKAVYGYFTKPDTICIWYCDHMKMDNHHELAHLISWQLASPGSQAIQEGIAEWFDRGGGGADNILWTIWCLHKGWYMKLGDMLDDDYFKKQWGNIAYAMMGAFTEWLISIYGMEKYLEFYRYRDCAEGFREVYGKTPDELNDLFVEYLKEYPLTDETKARFEKELRRYGLSWDGRIIAIAPGRMPGNEHEK